jgi:hypothetical protein
VHHPLQPAAAAAAVAAARAAEMWDQLFKHVDKQAHMKAMFELTTRMNSLARIVVGPANISATTALQVRPGLAAVIIDAWSLACVWICLFRVIVFVV